MRDYYGEVRAHQDQVNKLIVQTCKKDHNVTPEEMSACVQSLNKAWDLYADMLQNRIEERDRLIRRLMDELAERK